MGKFTPENVGRTGDAFAFRDISSHALLDTTSPDSRSAQMYRRLVRLHSQPLVIAREGNTNMV